MGGKKTIVTMSYKMVFKNLFCRTVSNGINRIILFPKNNSITALFKVAAPNEKGGFVKITISGH